MKTKLPYKTFDLFQSYNIDIPFIDKLYKWITSVGRYIVIGVEMIVLTAFIARFFLDQNLNDLKDKIEDNNKIIESRKKAEEYYRKIFDKTTDVRNIQNFYKNNLLDEIPKIFSIAPKNFKINNVTYDNNINSGISEESITINATSSGDLGVKYKRDLELNILNPNKNEVNNQITVKEIQAGTTKNLKELSYIFKVIKNNG